MTPLRNLFWLLLVAPILLAGSAGAAGQKVRIATEGSYAPFNYTTPDGQLAGFDVDIVRAICAKEALDCTITAQDWDGIIPGLLARKFDAIAASMSITDERRKRVDFTEKYYQTPARFVARKGAAIEFTKEGLKGKVIGAQRSTIHANYLNDNYQGIADIWLYDTQENADLDLVSGRLDAVLADAAVLSQGFLERPEGKDFAFVGPELKDPKWFGEGAGIAIRKGDDKLREVLNQGIEAIRADGTYDAINKKYFPFSIY
ncbi:MAG TPA: ABC transporter substrate-binding protein [Aliidongia sp.]|nr:ABC transporter substrate-binding protein [Aliidongia sp.]